jgi:hypothetical protein
VRNPSFASCLVGTGLLLPAGARLTPGNGSPLDTAAYAAKRSGRNRAQLAVALAAA